MVWTDIKDNSPIRFGLAVVLSPAIGAIAPYFSIVFMFLPLALFTDATPSGGATSWADTYQFFSRLFRWSGYGILYRVALMVVFGLPLHAALCRFRLRNAYAYAFFGALLTFAGLLLGILVHDLISAEHQFVWHWTAIWLTSVLSIPVGGFTGTAFFLIRGSINKERGFMERAE